MQRAQNRQSIATSFKMERFSAQLRALKLRATFPRAVAIAVLMDCQDDEEVTPQDLYLRIERAYGNVIPLVACYRILGDFEKAGLVQHRYQVRDGRASVVYRRLPDPAKPQEACFFCTNCRTKTALDDAAAQALIRQAAHRCGFHLAAAMLLHGLCEGCHFPTARSGP